MEVIIIDNHTRNLKKLKELLEEHHPKVLSVEDLGKNKINPEALMILSGGHDAPVLYNDLYSKEIDLIKSHRGPIIGICLGFELIAHVFGAHLHLRKKRFHGMVRLQKTDIPEADFLSNGPQKVYARHYFEVQNVPKPLIVLACSVSHIQIIRHSEKPIFGVQFHPEVCFPVNSGREIFKEILKQIC